MIKGQEDLKLFPFLGLRGIPKNALELSYQKTIMFKNNELRFIQQF